MPLPSLHRFVPTALLVVISLLLATQAGAELVWTPQTGWKFEGGIFDGTSSAAAPSSEGRGALTLMNKARVAEEKHHLGRAARLYKKVTKKYPHSVYAAEAAYREGNMRLLRQQYTKAFNAYGLVATRYPSSSRFNEIVGKQYQIATALLDGARPHYWGWLPGFTAREKGIEQLEVILAEAPYCDYAPLALMSVARGHAYFSESEDEIDALDRLVNTYPQSVLAIDAYLELGSAHASLVAGPYYDQGSTRDAITYYEDFMILYPSDNNVGVAEKGLTDMKHVLAESKVKIADFYFKRRDNFQAARVFYNEAITVYPDSDVAVKARQRLAEVDVAAAKAAEEAKHPKKKWFYFF